MASWSTLGIASLTKGETYPKASSLPDHEIVSLKNLLPRLQQESSQDLSAQPFRRQKLRHNFDHAQLLLLRIERDYTDVRSIRSWLEDARKTIKNLGFRLLELEQEALDYSQKSELTVEENNTPPIPFPSFDSTSPSSQPLLSPVTNSQNTEPSPKLTNSIQSRKKADHSHDEANLAIPFSSGTNIHPSPIALKDDKAKHTELSKSILETARELKVSQQSMAQRIKDDDENLALARKAMDKSSGKMEDASQRMGVATKMSEGRGWMGRMWLYGYIAALWLLAILVVFVMPKLRF